MAKNKLQVKFDYWLGDIVYQRVAAEAAPGMVTVVQIAGNDNVTYGVTWEGGSSFYFGRELTADINDLVRPPVKVEGLAHDSDESTEVDK